MTARARRHDIRLAVRAIAARYPHGARVLTLADEAAIYELRREHTRMIATENVANYVIRELETT